ncbi:MAG: DUF4190 domain-containing protein [Planctomycetota bacterium]
MTTDLAPAPVVERGASASMIELQSDAFKSPEIDGRDEFSYRPIPVLAPVSLVIGLCSIVGLASVAGLTVPLAGVILGILGWRQIAGARGEYGGFKLTMIGLVLSSICLMAGTSLHAYTYATEVPEGYERLSFRWLAEQKPIVEDGHTRINPEAKSLDGQKVFIKGYMYPENAKTNLKRFVLCKDTGQCCFGGKPSLTDMIVVEFVNEARADFRELSLVSVAGTFRAKKLEVGGELVAIYALEGEYFK